MPPVPDRLLPGRPDPLGANWDGLGVNFAVFSANAERVDLCLFDPAGRREVARLPLPECTDEVWHGYLPEARPGQLYGFRAFGPYEPRRGHRFNPHKLLLDPYAKALSGMITWDDATHGYTIGHPDADLSYDERDSAPFLSRCVVTDGAFDWGGDQPLRTPLHDSIIYEAHVKGLTMRHPEVPAQLRGTYDRVVVRAVAALPILAELALPFLQVGGLLVAQKGPITPEELNAGRRAAREVGGEVREVDPFQLPVTGDDRTLIVIEKVTATPEKYPRAVGIPNGKPLFWRAK